MHAHGLKFEKYLPKRIKENFKNHWQYLYPATATINILLHSLPSYYTYVYELDTQENLSFVQKEKNAYNTIVYILLLSPNIIL